MLKQTPHQWVHSYGDQPEIWRLHARERIEAITDRELVITLADELKFSGSEYLFTVVATATDRHEPR
jgi:hypothetical protein